MVKKNVEKIVSIMGSLAGALSIIFSFVVKSSDLGRWETASAYGGDAYTGIQNAAATTASNIRCLNEILSFGFFAILLIGGIALICHYLPTALALIEQDKVNMAVGAGAAPDHGPAAETNTAAVVSEDIVESVNEQTANAFDEIKKHKKMLDEGSISAEEFDAKKRELLGLGK